MLKYVNSESIAFFTKTKLKTVGGENMQKFKEIMENLPPELQQEVIDFANFLLATKVKPKQKKLRMSWAGALKEYKEKYTSLELQKKALEWWGD